MSYETTLVIAGPFLKFATVKLKEPNKPLNHKINLKSGPFYDQISNEWALVLATAVVPICIR